jgi:hypothetical protein
MGGRFVRWSKVANVDRARNCPLCGRDIEFRTYPEEVVVRVLAIVAVVGAAYWAKERGGGYLMVLLAVTAVLVILYLATSFRLRNRQRFKKGRNAV